MEEWKEGINEEWTHEGMGEDKMEGERGKMEGCTAERR